MAVLEASAPDVCTDAVLALLETALAGPDGDARRRATRLAPCRSAAGETPSDRHAVGGVRRRNRDHYPGVDVEATRRPGVNQRDCAWSRKPSLDTGLTES